MTKVEHVFQFDVTTSHHAAQARRKLDALIIGGYEIISINERDVWDDQTGRYRRIRSVRVYGANLNPTSDFQSLT